MKIISSKGAHLLLEGPLVTAHISTDENDIPLPEDHVPSTIIETSDNDFQTMNSKKSIIMLGKFYSISKLKIIHPKPTIMYTHNLLNSSGHYDVPAEYKPQNSPLQITGPSGNIIATNLPSSNDSKVINFLAREFLNAANEHRGWRKSFAEIYNTAKKWINQQENKGLKVALIILVGCVITMFWYLNAQFKEFQQLSQVNSF